MLERFEESIETFEEIEGKIRTNQLLFHYGIALNGVERYEDAIMIFQSFDVSDGYYIDALNQKGIALSRLDRYEESIEKQ